MSQKVGPYGGNKGTAFDDGVYDVVRKLIVGENSHGVSYFKAEYEKDGKIETTKEHGKKDKTDTMREFQLQYPDEYITSIQGTYSDVTAYNTTIVKTLIFKTSHGRTSPMFGNTAIFKTDFLVEGKDIGAKLIGFHGRSGDVIDSIGAHFYDAAGSSGVKQLEIRGGSGIAWDDGVYDGVRKVLVGEDASGSFVSYVKVEYVKGGLSIQHSHGNLQKEPKEFEVDYPNEHVTSVDGTYDSRLGRVKSVIIKTSKGRFSRTFGQPTGTRLELEEKGFMLVGLRGRFNDGLTALGANLAPLPVPAPAKKLEAKGGNGGAAWDDGFFDDVRKIYVGQGDSGVSFVKFEYDSGKKVVAGDGHGKKSVLGTEEFELDFPNEYIVSVEGRYEKVYGIEAEVVTMLRFKTNKRTSPPFGLDSGMEFVFEEKDHKVVGFHGKAGDFVHQVGVHVSPITKS